MSPRSIHTLNLTSRCFIKLTKPTTTTIPTIRKNFTSYNKPLYSYHDMYNAEHPIQRLHNESSNSSGPLVNNNGGSGEIEQSSMTYIKNTSGSKSYETSGFEPVVSADGHVSGDGHSKV
ncbi:hypothetical protein CANARDRAFT_28290 [[Candida] arabinofermentans NRRL YB-2248]|uniref:Uncharacterized protein n=1 Tax=[Candida] arabinofermentans NRRL YB-2248 TaxID=983967 RepID=A0A1E4T186_9ASCO|nr:hypothetical protein CANARDRAFT_28290 [[Candida] arabinofermentans NRRL YB-2248]